MAAGRNTDDLYNDGAARRLKRGSETGSARDDRFPGGSEAPDSRRCLYAGECGSRSFHNRASGRKERSAYEHSQINISVEFFEVEGVVEKGWSSGNALKQERMTWRDCWKGK